MTSPVTFSDPDAARYFCRAVAPKGALRGAGLDPPERWIARANAWAVQMAAEAPGKPWQAPRGVQRVALIVKGYKKGRGARFDAVPCQRCGKLLTAPESIAAGVGPECQGQ